MTKFFIKTFIRVLLKFAYMSNVLRSLVFILPKENKILTTISAQRR